MVERRNVVGGAAVTEEFYPGFRNSTASYTVSLLNPQVIRDLRLAQHGLRIVERPFSNFVPLADGRTLEVRRRCSADHRRSREVFGARRSKDCRRSMRGSIASQINFADGFCNRRRTSADRSSSKDGAILSPPRRLLLQMGRLPREGQRDLLDIFTKSAGDWLDSWFESEPLKAVLGWDSIVGNYASPYAPGSAYVLLHHVFGEVNGKRGKWGHAIGGMGAITQAMAAEARARGVQIDVDQPVQRVIVESGRATGVRIEIG